MRRHFGKRHNGHGSVASFVGKLSKILEVTTVLYSDSVIHRHYRMDIQLRCLFNQKCYQADRDSAPCLLQKPKFLVVHSAGNHDLLAI
jgi:hypothetical protein